MSKKESGGEKSYTFDQQLDLLHERRGIPQTDAKNVFNGLASIHHDLIDENANKGVQKFSFQTPLGMFGFELQPEQTRRTSDGSTHQVPAHYEGFSYFPKTYLERSNANFDLSTKVLTKEEIKQAKKVA